MASKTRAVPAVLVRRSPPFGSGLRLAVLVVVLAAGCAGKGGVGTTASHVTPAPRTFASREAHFSVIYDPTVMTMRVRRTQTITHTWVQVTFTDRDTSDRPFPLPRVFRGRLVITAVEPNPNLKFLWTFPGGPDLLPNTEANLEKVHGCGPVTGSYSQTVFKGLQGWRYSLSWKQGTESRWELDRQPWHYTIYLVLARSVPPRVRAAFYNAGRSFGVNS